MNWKLIIPFSLLLVVVRTSCAIDRNTVKAEIVITVAKFPFNLGNKLFSLLWTTANYTSYAPNWSNKSANEKDGYIRWSIPTSQPLLIRLDDKLKIRSSSYILEPGDSIQITYLGDNPIITGTGVLKLKMFNDVDSIINSIVKPANSQSSRIYSVEDYVEYNKYLDEIMENIDPVIESYKDRLSVSIFESIKAYFINDIEYKRMLKFMGLKIKAKALNVTPEMLCYYYDLSMHSKASEWLKKYPENAGQTHFLYYTVQFKYLRNLNFLIKESYTKEEFVQRQIILYKMGEKLFEGNARENFLTMVLTSKGLKDFSGLPAMENLLAEYYKKPGISSHKLFVKDYEQKVRRRMLTIKYEAPDFVGLDKDNVSFSKKDFSDKIVCLMLWSENNKDLDTAARVFCHIQDKFYGDSNVVFVTISTETDKEKLRELLGQSPFAFNKGGVHLASPDSTVAGLLRSTFNLHGLPAVYLLNGSWEILESPYTNALQRDGEHLIDRINEVLPLCNDGPYVIREEGVWKTISIRDNKLLINLTKRGITDTLSASTDKKGSFFKFVLKDIIINEPWNFDRPNKLFVLSDIEGNFSALRKLLQSNKIIDKNFNWIYGNGHLVFCGDMFDRGQQVTECLWLIYSLEEKAKKYGGYVHFIIGNHEVMNMEGDFRYTTSKYINNAQKLGYSNSRLYDQNSELGKWLRSKNVLERIGNLLFLHGGVSSELLDLRMNIDEINNTARLYLEHKPDSLSGLTSSLRIIFGSKSSPFWFRSYYAKDSSKMASMSLIDSTLNFFSINKIITGHTVVSANISSHFNGKVINTDTQHANGESEALLIENDHYFRVDPNGKKYEMKL